MPLDRLETLKVERGMLQALVRDLPRGRPELARRLKRVTAEIMRAELQPARSAVADAIEDEGQELKWWQR